MPRRIGIAFVALIAACGDAPQSTTTITDSAGVRLVSGTSPDRVLDWGFVPALKLGGRDEGPESFFNVSRHAIGSDASGNIYVLDANGHRVLVFGSDGRHLRTLGREGEGPGELSWPFGISVRPDGTVLVDDVGKGRLVVFSSDGAASDSEESVLPGSRRAWYSEGFYSSVETRDEEGTHFRFVHVAGRDTTDLSILDEPTGKPVELKSCGMSLSGMRRIFAPNLVWDAWGGMAASRSGAAYEISIFDGTQLVALVRRSVAPMASSPDLAVRELGDGMRFMTAGGVRECDNDELIEQRGIAPQLAAIRDLRVDPAGRIWVSRSGPASEATPTDVIDSDGRYLGTLPAERPFPLGFLPDGRALAAETNELGITRLVVYRIEKVPSGFEPE